MKKDLHIILDDEEIIDLYRALIDDDAAATLEMLKKHLKSEIVRVLEGGCKVMISVPGAGTTQITSRLPGL